MSSACRRSLHPACRALLLALAAAPVPAGADDGPAPGPLPVRLITVGEDGKAAPVANAFLSLGGRRASTDREGLATVDGLPAGRHTLKVTQSGFDTVSQAVDVPPGARQALRSA